MKREELLAEINEVIEHEYGTAIDENATLASSGVDSFGLIMVVTTISDKYELYTSKEFKKLKFEELTAKDLIDRIEHVCK